MSAIVDRRQNDGHKSAVNQQRFLRRYRALVREEVARAITGRKIAEADREASISIPARGLHEPVFSHGAGGRREFVLPGNREYVCGDELARPQGGSAQGAGGRASPDGEGEDAFRFHLSRKEFLDFFFEDMALPNIAKTHLTSIPQSKRVRGGYRTDGSPSNLAVVRTLRGSLARRLVLSASNRARLREIEEELAALEPEDPRAVPLLAERAAMIAGIARIPFIDSFDLRYRNRVVQPHEIAQAVMFCIMDVSGSMDENRKDLAKRFFILLHLFLLRHYERIAIVFLRHHTSAKVVEEEEFFRSTESGGTLVSSALDLALKEIGEHFPVEQWNIYVAQASDGENWENDSSRCRDLLVNELLPKVQYFAYIEINNAEPQNLWANYEKARAAHDNIALGRVRERADIYPVLHELFAKKSA
ncbi:MAG: hypothetical protein A3H35_12670 [Betaproteobacteria bacterium RIFCSPLOWO2_02_FULL_62_17]|nr:MAG: hypothetical protein A3H35_12670 [Betaproteobacteria bacterium RIFCSPLOWO2_02_FULL_62_17]